MTAFERVTHLPIILRILLGLYFCGHRSYQLGVGHRYLIAASQPVVSRCIAEVTNAVVTNFLNFVEKIS